MTKNEQAEWARLINSAVPGQKMFSRIIAWDLLLAVDAELTALREACRAALTDYEAYEPYQDEDPGPAIMELLRARVFSWSERR